MDQSGRPLRIALMISGVAVNGVAAHCLLLTRFLLGRGHRVLLLHRPGAWIAAQPEIAGAELFETTFKRNARELLRVARRLEAFQPDVLHTHMSSAHTYGMLARLFTPYPVVATAHSATLQLHWYFNNIVIATSPAAAAHHARVNRVPRRAIRMIPNFIDSAQFPPIAPDERTRARAMLGLAETDFVIGSVGELGGRKRQIDLVLALARLRPQHPNATLVLVGGADDPYAAALVAAAEREGVRDHVVLTGARRDVPLLLAAFDAMALSSERETGPIAVLEAMARRLPVASTRVGMTPYFLDEGRAGALVPIGDVAALAAAISDLIERPGRRAAFAATGRARVLTHYDLGVVAPQIEAALREAAAIRNRPPLGFFAGYLRR